jgi:hypothetical protein
MVACYYVQDGSEIGRRQAAKQTIADMMLLSMSNAWIGTAGDRKPQS